MISSHAMDQRNWKIFVQPSCERLSRLDKNGQEADTGTQHTHDHSQDFSLCTVSMSLIGNKRKKLRKQAKIRFR